MLRYLLRRAISGLIALFIFQTIIFFVIQWVFPGDYASQFAFYLTPQEMDELRLELGLDQPLTIQYFRWLSSLVSGNPPLYRIMVINLLKYQLPATLLAFGTATFLAFLLGVWLGKVVAWRKQNSLTDGVTLSAVILSASFPPLLCPSLRHLFT
jgi:peptide/nickel transport system permease protein